MMSAVALLAVPLLTACQHSDEDIKTQTKTSVEVFFNEVDLDWDTNTFVHNGYTINIPEKWGVGVLGKRELFQGYDPHDIKFVYTLIKNTTYGGDVFYTEAAFEKLVKEDVSKKDKIFEIPTIGMDIDSKLLVKDELANDYYFKYDTNVDYYNHCYFKIAKNDVNQLKDGYFNQINVRLKYLVHVDSALSFEIKEADGLNDVGYYSDVSISHNPDLVKQN